MPNDPNTTSDRPLSPRGVEEPTAILASALLNKVLVVMLVVWWAACRMDYLIFLWFCLHLLSMLLADVVTEALSLAGRMLIIIVGHRGDAFFVPDVFGREQRC